jgi:hypothetical protein
VVAVVRTFRGESRDDIMEKLKGAGCVSCRPRKHLLRPLLVASRLSIAFEIGALQSVGLV